MRPDSCTKHFVRGNFRDLARHLEGVAVGAGGTVDGMLLDLGFSSMQVDDAARGFSFRREGGLDMRMDPAQPLSAREIVNEWSEEQLGRVLRDFGEERHWRRLARRILEYRSVHGPIETTLDLVDALGAKHWQPRRGRRGRGRGGKGGGIHREIHPATRAFQGLRIAVNDELGSVEAALPAAVAALAPGGRLGVISFHSLEDRIVKWGFREMAGRERGAGPLSREERFGHTAARAPPKRVRVLTKKPLEATAAEREANARARSAKLRFVERNAPEDE